MSTAVAEAPLDLRAVWRRWRLPALVVLIVLGTAVVLAAVATAPAREPLDPRDPSGAGGRALAEILRDRDVTVVAVPRVSALELGSGTTVVVPDPQGLTRSELGVLTSSSASLVVIAPSDRELAELAPSVHEVDGTSDRTLNPSCALQAATVAGRVRFSGALYDAPAGTRCYLHNRHAGLVVVPRGGTTVTLLGSLSALSNDRLDDEGNAALGLGLLSAQPSVQWLLPRPATNPPVDAERKGLVELLPVGLQWALLQLVIAVVVIGLWRARRLGPVVVEPLPVVVRAVETVEGRARLLRGAGARDTAAEALRAASRERIRELVGLEPQSTRESMVEETARRAGREPSEIAQVLYGAEPRDDAALVRLADQLDQIENDVRRG